MEDFLVPALAVAASVLFVLGLQLVLHRDRWRRLGVRTTGAYREAPRDEPGRTDVRWDVVGIGSLASLWGLVTFGFVAAGSLLLLLVFEQGHAPFVASLLTILASGVAFGGLSIRAASRLVRRHDHAPRSARKVAIHGVVHHLAVLALFAVWAAVEEPRSLDDVAVVLGPICAVGGLVSVLVGIAGRTIDRLAPTMAPA